MAIAATSAVTTNAVAMNAVAMNAVVANAVVTKAVATNTAQVQRHKRCCCEHSCLKQRCHRCDQQPSSRPTPSLQSMPNVYGR